MFTLILFAFLSASPDGQVRTAREVVATGLTWEECNRKKAKAAKLAKQDKLKHVGAKCEPEIEPLRQGGWVECRYMVRDSGWHWVAVPECKKRS